ncbi:hypothetical protein FB451DRAFT_106344 [Mycena latifolia]|nr:hypothetical protein FB451DRAFT_106344 [Mycena latifolia]
MPGVLQFHVRLFGVGVGGALPGSARDGWIYHIAPALGYTLEMRVSRRRAGCCCSGDKCGFILCGLAPVVIILAQIHYSSDTRTDIRCVKRAGNSSPHVSRCHGPPLRPRRRMIGFPHTRSVCLRDFLQNTKRSRFPVAWKVHKMTAGRLRVCGVRVKEHRPCFR